VNSILLVGVVSFVIGLLSLIGVGQAEAFQLIWNAGGIFYALTYLVMFAIPLIGLRGIKPAPSMWLKITSLSGLLMTALYCALSIFPIIQVASVTTFALKILLVLLVANAIGVGLYVSARRKPVGVAVTEA